MKILDAILAALARQAAMVSGDGRLRDHQVAVGGSANDPGFNRILWIGRHK
jgi:hypothetical protein